MKAYVLYSTYLTAENKTQIQLFGKLENNQSFVSLHDFQPYMFIKAEDEKKVSKYLKKFKAEKTKLTNFKGESVMKISSDTNSELQKLYKAIHKKIETYEADIKPQQQFLIDSSLTNTIDIEGDYQSSEKIDRIYKNPSLNPIKDYSPKLKTISIDLESDKKSDKLFCIGLYGENYKRNFLVTESKKEIPHTTNCKTEEECLEKFKAEIIKQDPDIITGWNVIDFDFVYLRQLFQKHKILFDLGRTNEQIKLRIESNFFRSSSIDIPGRQVLDGLNLIKESLIANSPTMRSTKFESFGLEDVAQAILKKGKILKGKTRHDEIEKLYKTNPEKLVEYNLLDCELAYEIIKETKILDLVLEKSLLTALPLDRFSSSISAFDSLYIREAQKKGFVSPTSYYQKKPSPITGGYVSSLKPGIYKNVLILDFKSLYPSIIKTFNIDPASFLEKKSPDSIESPNKAHFKNSDGILPGIISRLHEAREKAKKEKRELASYTIKIIMNSFFGVLASPNSRYFSLDIGNAITHFGQKIIKLTAEEIEKKFSHPVIYSDTDSVFVHTSIEKTKANKLGKEIQDYINSFYKNYTKKEYNRTSYLELEFEKQYLSMMIPKIRGKEETAAAKKRYAGLKDNGELEIVGLEAIRGDWTEAAQDFQRELLNKVFHDEKIEIFIKTYVKKIEEGKLDDKLIYRKSIRKSLEEYTKTTPPHVKAARQLPSLTSNVIEYVITEKGPEPIQLLKHKLDYKHYIEKQIKPIANQVLSLFNKDFDEITQTSRQSKLF